MSGRGSVGRRPHAGGPAQWLGRGEDTRTHAVTDVVLDATRHFESLRTSVWNRLRGRHGALLRDRFEDAYSEWWAREVERAAAGRPSRAAAPVAFVTESVHRVMLDDVRARARGLPRGDKAALQVMQLEALLDAGAEDDTEAQARYEALAHRILALVRHRLTSRELRVFVCTFLYLQSTDATARLLDLSPPRVKKDRAKAATKLGDEVWELVAAELDVCPAQADRDLSAVFEVLADHVEGCTACAPAFGRLRSGALAAVAPIELLTLSAGGGGGAGSLVDWVYGRLVGVSSRWPGAGIGVSSGGRAAASAAVAASLVAGGGAAVVSGGATDPAGQRPASIRSAQSVSSPAPAPSTAAPAAAAAKPATRHVREAKGPRRRRGPSRRPKQSLASAPAPTPAASAPASPPPAPVQAPAVAPAPAPAPASSSTGEFGFERG